MVPNRGTEAVVHGGHDAYTLGIGDEEQAGRGRPLEGEHGAGKVLAELDHVDDAETGDGSDIDDRREDGRDVAAVGAGQAVR